MKTIFKQLNKTWSLTAKFTEDEQKLILEAAEDAGLRPSEWCRRTIMEALIATPNTMFLGEEIIALRALVSQMGIKHMDIPQADMEAMNATADALKRQKTCERRGAWTHLTRAAGVGQ